MNAIQKKSKSLVSDRAYRLIFTRCIDVMTQKGVSPDIFTAVIKHQKGA